MLKDMSGFFYILITLIILLPAQSYAILDESYPLTVRIIYTDGEAFFRSVNKFDNKITRERIKSLVENALRMQLSKQLIPEKFKTLEAEFKIETGSWTNLLSGKEVSKNILIMARLKSKDKDKVIILKSTADFGFLEKDQWNIITSAVNGAIIRLIPNLVAQGGDKQVGLEILKKNLSDLPEDVAAAFAEIGDKQAVPYLLTVLSGNPKNSFEKASIAKALGKLGDASALPTLRKVLLKTDIKDVSYKPIKAAISKLENAPPTEK